MNDYPYIGIWGHILGSHSYYIAEQQQRAKAEKAPPNAIYRLDTGEWATTDDVSSWRTRADISRECLRHGITDPYASKALP